MVLDNLQEYTASVDPVLEACHIDNKSKEANIKHRKKLIKWGTRLSTCYLICVILILCYTMISKGLNSSVLITLLGTTTAIVLGLPLVVLKGLFKER